jgi:hypothetical protein
MTADPEAGWTPLTDALLQHLDVNAVIGNSCVPTIFL